MSNLIIRPIEENDLKKKYLELFDPERKANTLSTKKALEIFKKIKSCPNHKIFVAVLDSEIVGSATIIIEQKFVRGGGIIGHIEDVEVKKNYRGKKIGSLLIKELIKFAEQKECYKTILDCSNEIMPFYENIGFRHQTVLGSNVMRYDHSTY